MNYTLSLTRLGMALILSLVVSLFFSASVSAATPGDLSRHLMRGMVGEDVRFLQQLLNSDPTTMVATDGPGAPGNETEYYGPRTEEAVKRFQAKYAADILIATSLDAPTGIVGRATLALLRQQQVTNTLAQAGSFAVTQQSETSQTAEALVDHLYNCVLGRAADPDGRTTWINRAKTYTLESMFTGFYYSAEFAKRRLTEEQLIDSLFTCALSRTATAEERTNWIGKMTKTMFGTSDRNGLVSKFVASAEFQTVTKAKWGGTLGSTQTQPTSVSPAASCALSDGTVLKDKESRKFYRKTEIPASWNQSCDVYAVVRTCRNGVLDKGEPHAITGETFDKLSCKVSTTPLTQPTSTTPATGTTTVPNATCTLTATPSAITLGQSATLSWTSTNAAYPALNLGLGPVAVTGSMIVQPTSTRTYDLELRDSENSPVKFRCRARVTVAQPTVPVVTPVATTTVPLPTCTLVATPAVVRAGQSATLTWSSTNAAGLATINNRIGDIDPKNTAGYRTVQPTATTTYTMTVQNSKAQKATCSVQVGVVSTVVPTAPVPTCTFQNTPTTVSPGQEFSLQWISQNAAKATISRNVGGTRGMGEVPVVPVLAYATDTRSISNVSKIAINGTTTFTVTLSNKVAGGPQGRCQTIVNVRSVGTTTSSITPVKPTSPVPTLPANFGSNVSYKTPEMLYLMSLPLGQEVRAGFTVHRKTYRLPNTGTCTQEPIGYIDWGDNTPREVTLHSICSSVGGIHTSHKYSQPGEYIVTVTDTAGGQTKYMIRVKDGNSYLGTAFPLSTTTASTTAINTPSYSLYPELTSGQTFFNVLAKDATRVVFEVGTKNNRRTTNCVPSNFGQSSNGFLQTAGSHILASLYGGRTGAGGNSCEEVVGITTYTTFDPTLTRARPHTFPIEYRDMNNKVIISTSTLPVAVSREEVGTLTNGKVAIMTAKDLSVAIAMRVVASGTVPFWINSRVVAKVDWGDGTVQVISANLLDASGPDPVYANHTYSRPGTYQVSVAYDLSGATTVNTVRAASGYFTLPVTQSGPSVFGNNGSQPEGSGFQGGGTGSTRGTGSVGGGATNPGGGTGPGRDRGSTLGGEDTNFGF